MKKSILPLLGLTVLGNLLSGVGAGAMSATRIEERNAVRWETDQPFLVTEIRPADGYLVMVYTDLGKTGRRVTNANIVWEKETGVGGELVSELRDQNPDWAVTAYNKKIAGTAYFVSGYEQTFTVPMTDLTENTSGILYYYITVAKSAEYSLYGKVDYSACLKSPLYREGVTCRLEVDEDGEPGYYPYQDGEKLKEEEPEEPEEKPEEPENPEEQSEEGPEEEAEEPEVQPEEEAEEQSEEPEVFRGGDQEETIAIEVSEPINDFVAYDLSTISTPDKNTARNSDTQDVAEVLPLGRTESQQSTETEAFNWWWILTLTVVIGTSLWFFFWLFKRKKDEDEDE